MLCFLLFFILFADQYFLINDLFVSLKYHTASQLPKACIKIVYDLSAMYMEERVCRLIDCVTLWHILRSTQ